jgi:SAM-dependent methyltransferase
MLSQAQSERIHRAVASEIRRFMEEPAFARRMARHPFHARIGDWIDTAVGRRVLELGVGPGRYAALLQTLGFEVVGIDPIPFDSWELIRLGGRSEFYPGVKAEALPFRAQEFDHVVCMGALLYFENPNLALKEAHRVLKPGGRLIVRTQNRNNLYALSTGRPLEPSAHNFYTMKEVAALLRSERFDVCRQFSWGFWPPWVHMEWWYAMNVLPVPVISALGALTPPPFRHNHITFARRAD